VRGNLSEFTLGQLLQFFALAERSGTITINAKGRVSRLLVESDRIVGWGLDSFDPRAMLLAADLLPAPARSAIEQVSPRPETPGLSFIVRNLVEPERWDGFAQRQLEQDIYPLLSLDDGEFEVEVMRCPPAPLRFSIPVNSVILDGSRWESEIEAVQLEGHRLDSTWRRAATIPAENLRLTSLEWMVWALLTEPMTLGDLAARLAVSDLATIGAVKRLRSCGLVEQADE
jgi:hypothetical protein